jgi:TolA-binding protein
MENKENIPGTPDSSTAGGFSLATFSEDLWMRYSRQILTVVAAIVLVAAVWFGWSAIRARNAEADNKLLGSVYVLLREENYPAAEQALLSFLSEGRSGIAQDKANLFLGKILYLQERYDEAQAAYEKVGKGGKDVSLLYGGALHGRAAVHMQKSEYDKAVAVLEELVETYGARKGNPEENLSGSEVVDFTPNIANALWKLALCQRELGQIDGAKASAERLVKAYPGTREAGDAEKLLTTL